QVPKDIDGLSILPILLSQPTNQKQHDYLYWAFYEGNRAGQAIRMGTYKAIEQPKGSPIRIYDLAVDIGEQKDIAAEKPDLVEKATVAMSQANRPSEKWKFLMPKTK
ncbi:MAG: N-acetylgalactosamine-6-sulfatase, partial [Planctomycetales bacterium]|nr:N-acetylgalactosamine-6-sulfatase [Planctomycetales bacterium]